jgi:hypothetical protein|tara:strand:- start:556 stop:807 length:252 start_codon:yes stop_codon:yes gene_type:complete
MSFLQKLLPSRLGIFNKLGAIMATRMFRATFVDSFSHNTIVVEFEAPFPVDEQVDYKKLATQRLGEMIRKDLVKIRDIEPIEI